MDLDTFAEKLGMTVVAAGPNWAIHVRPDPSGVNSAPNTLVHLQDDGSVRIYAEVNDTATPENIEEVSQGYAVMETSTSLEELHNMIFSQDIDEMADRENMDGPMDAKLIRHMISQGWEYKGPHIFHADLDLSFDSWTEAIMACINVASE